MARLILLATSPELESELRALSGQIESQKFFTTDVRSCPSVKHLNDLDSAMCECMNGASAALVPLIGESIDAGMRALAVLRTPVIILTDATGYHEWREHKLMITADVFMTILTGNSNDYPRNLPVSGVVRVGSPLPWHSQLHAAVAEEVVAAVRKRPMTSSRQSQNVKAVQV